METYFEHARPEMMALVPAMAKRVLDVGCGAGAFSARLKSERPVEVWGVEMNSDAARKASERLDKVVCAPFDSSFDAGPIRFDCIIFNDVLEHMACPEIALETAHALLSPQGVVVASIPNARHLTVVWELAVQGDWRYRDAGIFDRTHLRFFTRTSILRLFREQRYEVRHCEGINEAVGRKFRVLNTIFLNRLTEMRYLQYAVVAAPAAVPGNAI
jgi:2-polyprenyl-3-methyl-5-hydroxy-6-metoxy-1,4-benzoquinol methylase